MVFNRSGFFNFTMKRIPKAEITNRLAKFDPDHAKRLRGLYDLWRNPAGEKSLTQWQRAELVRAGLVTDEAGTVTGGEVLPANVPPLCSGQKLAAILTSMFGSFVSPMAVSRSLHDEGMTGKLPSGKWKTAEAIRWWKQHRVDAGEKMAALMAEANEADLRKKISDARRSQVEADEAIRLLDAKWILKAEAQATCTKTALDYHAIAKRALDRDFGKTVLAKTKDAGFDDDQLARIAAACVAAGREVVETIESACHNYETPKD